MLLRLFFEVLLLVTFCWTAITAAATTGLLPQDKCGVSSAPNQATDTNKVGLHEYPWIACLKYKRGDVSETKPTIRCTGTLINKRYILTTADCVVRITSVEIMLEGTEKGAPAPQEFNISENDIIVHPGYKKLANDIALIRLPKDVDDSTTPVCLPIQDSAKNNQFTHNLTVAGWFLPLDKLNPDLEKVSVTVVSNTKCIEKYSGLVNISEKHLCAGDATFADACARNGGSPLTDQVDLNGVVRTVQYGIASFGSTGCTSRWKEFPRVYTRVSAYTDWILENIKAS